MSRFTSVAFGHTAIPDAVKLVQSWSNHRSADQVPTEIHYTCSEGAERNYTWGYEVPKGGNESPQTLKWFKLLLQNSARSGSGKPPPGTPSSSCSESGGPTSYFGATLSRAFNRLGLQQDSDDDDDEWVDVAQFSTPAVSAGKEIERLNLHPIDVIADFLSGVLKTTKMSIESSYEPEFVHLSKPFFVLAVPAIWSDRAKAHMVEAATKAGFGNHRVDFELIGEPEAAAAYTIKIIQPQELPIGTSFVVADIGGGTGDLICYSIRDLKPLRINESVVGDGDLCGSVYLDKAFEVYIRNLLGNKTIDNMNPRAKAEMMRTWTEKVKHSFGSGDSVEYEVTLASIKSDPAKRIEGGFHIMEP